MCMGEGRGEERRKGVECKLGGAGAKSGVESTQWLRDKTLRKEKNICSKCYLFIL